MDLLEKQGVVVKDIKDPDTAGQYDRVEDKVHLNPELATTRTAAEEFYHRRQEMILRQRGISEEERDSQLYITAGEVGIIPQVRSIGLKKGEEDANYEFFRYMTEAYKFASNFIKASEEQRARFLEAVAGERMYSGLAWVFKKMGEAEYKEGDWMEMALADPTGDRHWEEVNEEALGWIGVK